LPLRFKGQVLGSLNVYSEMPDAFDIQEAGLLQEVADHVAFALASIRLEDEVVEAKRRMRQSNAALTAFERCPVPMLATDVDGYVSAVSAEMADLLGMSRREAEDAQQNLRELDLFVGAEPAAHLDDLFTRKETVEFTLP
jgi:GAF domain-containing protein